MRNLSALKAIVEGAESIREWTKGGSQSSLADPCVRAAVERKFEVIGTAVKSLRSEMQPKYPDLPWDKFVEIKDLIGRNYMPADGEALWKVIREELEPFARRVMEIESLSRSQADSAREKRSVQTLD